MARKKTTTKPKVAAKAKGTRPQPAKKAADVVPLRRPAAKPGEPCCGLCGNTKGLTKTECCGNWICDDEANYVLFSYARNSCHRNHDRFTLCAFHFNEKHTGRWQDCPKCREDQQTELYVYYGTNEYNFEKLENPPKFKPTLCRVCKRRIVLGEGGYSMNAEGYTCMECYPIDMPDFTGRG